VRELLCTSVDAGYACDGLAAGRGRFGVTCQTKKDTLVFQVGYWHADDNFTS